MDAWDQVMKLAEQNGFIVYTYGGIAFLMCHEEQKKHGTFEECQYKAGLAPFPDSEKII